MQLANIVLDSHGHCRVIDLQGAHFPIKSGRSIPICYGLTVLGTPSHQPWSVPHTGAVSHSTDIFAIGCVAAQVIGVTGDVFKADGDIAHGVISVLNNRIILKGLGSAQGGPQHVALMHLEDTERDWVWRRKPGILSHPGPGRHYITKIVGIKEANKLQGLQDLNPELKGSFPIRTVHEVFGNGEEHRAAETLMDILVYRCSSLREADRIPALKEAIAAARKLVKLLQI
jgi:hypothetical protein